MNPKVDDSLNITLNIKWLVQLCVLIGSMVWAWFSITADLEKNLIEVADLRERVVEQHKDMQRRLQVLEDARATALDEVNKGMMKRLFGNE